MVSLRRVFVLLILILGSAGAVADGDLYLDDYELWPEAQKAGPLACKRASRKQVSTVNAGNEKVDKFLSRCYAQTNHSTWCDEIVRPNPDSKPTFSCTYGANQPHLLVHPNEGVWIYAIRAINLVRDLETKGIRVCQIYNWWRPEPYNGNVGGAPTRHPHGTSVDVRFCSNNEAVNGFYELCKHRRAGRIRAIGYYGSTGLHFGVGDTRANTWGLSCP